MRRSTAALAPRSLLLLALALVAGSTLGGRSEAQARTTDGSSVTTGTTRQGLRIRFASIDGQSGLDGTGFLLFSSRRTSLDAAPTSPCPSTRVVRAEARGSGGLVRKVQLTLHLRGQGELPIRADGCPRAELRAELDDGTTLSGGEGTVTVLTSSLSAGDRVSATYSWTATRGTTPFPMRGEFNLTLP
ncbi:MAG: hypothetical protein IPL19_21235 [Sandaracinaceae bacterium]|nr:hypothetical protein [Sandaracinaceae bacterium]